MATKKYGLFILATLIVLFGGAIAMADNSVTPSEGEVGTTVTLYIDTNVEAGTTYDILLGTKDTGVDLITNTSSEGTATVTIPEITANTYNFFLKNATTTVDSGVSFEVKNSKPEITVTSLSMYVDDSNVGTIQVSDKNGKELADCSIEPSVAGTALDSLVKNIVATKNDNLDACVLTLPAGKEPTGSDVGEHTFNLTATDAQGGTDEETITLTVEDYIKITKVKIDDNTGDSKDHLPGDEIDMEITVKNNLDQDLRNVVVNIDNNDLELDEDSPEIDIDKNDDYKFSFTFTIPYDVDKGQHTIDISVKGDDENDNSRYAEDSYDLDVNKNYHDLAITNINLDKSEATAGDQVILSFKLINIGRSDEKNVKITIKNSELGIERVLDTFNLDSADEKLISEKFDISDKAYDGYFKFLISVDSDKDHKYGDTTLKLSNCNSDLFSVSTDKLEVYAGKAVKVMVTIENIGLDSEDFKFKIDGLTDVGEYTSSEDLDKISLDAGESKEFEVTITSNKSAAIDLHNLNFELYKDGNLIASKEVSLNVKEGGLLTGAFLGGGSDVGLAIGIIIAIGLIGYLSYTIWFKKPKTPEEGKEDEEGNIIFEDDDEKKK